ncbi:putative CENPB DNA-binding domain-containing protein 1 [Palaemon carinicauda]|uniref:putative CENPB DNA-binding domain-containing protein 1 n=1 Tax=Palaemon carinicauda TaxID=392227 RepID=UPI0035B5FE75
MAPKRKADSSDGSAAKKRKAITIEVKLDIIKRSKNTEMPTNIGRSLGLVIRPWLPFLRIKSSSLNSMKATVITKQCSGLIIEMERLLVLWLEDQNQRRILVSLKVIQEKAKR